MSTFCGRCGTAIEGHSKFCAKCGAATGPTAPAASSTSQVAARVPAPKGMSTLGKLAIAAVAIIFVGGGVAVAGMYYAVHRVREKFHEAVGGKLDDVSPAQKSSSPSSLGNVCRYLSKEDVGAGIGVEVVRAESIDNGCNFYAKGDQAEMTAKHMSAMMAAKGADVQTQKMIQGITGALGKSFQSEKNEASDGSGTVVVLNYSIDNNSAVEQMGLNRRAMQHIGGPAVQDMPGVGDEAFITGDSSIIARKGDKLIRVTYMTCPCGTKAVEPLVQKLAAAL
jgi:hypothetical protein